MAIISMAVLLSIATPTFAETQSESVTLETLLREMIDLERLYQKPEAGERNAQSSSYNRASRIENGERIGWFENRDRGYFLREIKINGRTEQVMADIDGPGVIVRIWSANPAGTLRIYLDDAAEPVLETEFALLFSGDLGDPFVEPFSGFRSRGANLYFPIPFAKRAVVTCEGSTGLFYHVNHRQFPVGTKVETFSFAAAKRAKPVADVVAARLSEPYDTWSAPVGCISRQIHWKLGQGEKASLDLAGPASIVAIQLRAIAADLENSLRDTVITITWDDLQSPSVWAPLGDFFGTGPGFNPYNALPCGMLPAGLMYSHWVMPFASKARIEVHNEGSQPITLFGRIITRPINWSDSSLYFHAKWLTEYPIPARPFRDWCMVKADGPGRFVGTSLSIANHVKRW